MNDHMQDEMSAIADWIIDQLRKVKAWVRGWFA